MEQSNAAKPLWLSKKCAPFRRRRWIESERPAKRHLYVSHYNSVTRACYVMFYDVDNFVDDSGKDSSAKLIDIVDAFEGREYASCLELPIGKIAACTADGNDCHSEAEFRARVFKLFGIAQ